MEEQRREGEKNSREKRYFLLQLSSLPLYAIPFKPSHPRLGRRTIILHDSLDEAPPLVVPLIEGTTYGFSRKGILYQFSDLRSFFPCVPPLPCLCAAPAWCPPCSCPNPRPSPPSLPCCRCPKEGERAARPAAQVVFPLARVFLHTPWSNSSLVLCSHDGICNFVEWWQQKIEGGKREETPSSLSSLQGTSLASCVSSRDNLG
jgi:hypothetical protein